MDSWSLLAACRLMDQAHRLADVAATFKPDDKKEWSSAMITPIKK